MLSSVVLKEYKIITSFIQTSARYSSTTKNSYNYLQKSKVPSYHFQKSLLRLPIPILEKTCSRYLRAQKVILSPEEYRETEKTVKDFEKNDGPKLQERLIAMDKANKHTSYISQPWFDMYLCDRVPLPLNYNPFMSFHSELRSEYNHPVVRCTNLIISSSRFLRTLREQLLSPEVFHLNPSNTDKPWFWSLVGFTPQMLSSYAAYAVKAFPLDMSQYRNLFNSTRIPCKGKDKIQSFDNAKHILMMKNGNFFVFDLFDKDGNLYSPGHIHACAQHIYNLPVSFPKHPVAILTSSYRDEWAKLRDELLAAGNAESLHAIDSAAFNIVFDPQQLNLDPVKSYRTFLYGEAGNRWFDKSFSVIFTADGETALNFEHSWGDGVAVMRYFNEVATELEGESWVSSQSQPSNIDASQFVKQLEFKLTPRLETEIENATKAYHEATNALAVDIYESDILGKNICKKLQLSPDSVMQLGFQVAYNLQNGHPVATYESCSTAAFKHGRTETMRPATLETQKVANALSGAQQMHSKDELKQLIKEASKMHGQLTKEAAMGQGFDRHLFGLKHICELSNEPLPPLYTDVAYKKINHNIISTSTLPSNKIKFGGFAPVVRDGFGLGYQIQDKNHGLVVASYPLHRDGAGFIECAQKAYRQIRDIVS